MIWYSSLWVNSLNVTVFFDFGSVNVNSFVVALDTSSFSSLFSTWDKSTVCDSPLYSNEYSEPYPKTRAATIIAFLSPINKSS